MTDPLSKSKEQFSATIDTISSEKSAVGIDAQYTHAIIIDYLQQITKRLETLEQYMSTHK